MEFPICTDSIAFKSSRWKIRPLPDDQRRIIQSVQPYNAVPNLSPDQLRFSFNRAVDMLHDWSRKDRHRTLHVVGSWASNVSPGLDLPDGGRVVRVDLLRDGFFLEPDQGNEIATFQLTGWRPGLKLKANPSLSIDIALDEIPAPTHDTDTLYRRFLGMVVAVRAAIEALAKSVGVVAPQIPVRGPL